MELGGILFGNYCYLVYCWSQKKKYAKGHDFWEPGVYCTPLVSTAKWYARPHIVFGDGVYHCIMYELRVDPLKIKTERERGGVQ